MMIDSSSSSSKSKLELKLIGPQSSRNQLRQSNNLTSGSVSSSSQIGFSTACNTARNQQNVTPKRQSSNHNGNSINQGSNLNINQNNMNACNTPSSNYGSLLNGTPSSLNAQMSNRLQGNSYLNKANNNGSSVGKLSNMNFSKKNGGGIGTNLGSTKSNLNNHNHHSGSIVGNYGNSNLNQNQGSTFSKDKMNTVMKNNMSKQKTNSNMHMTHKNQILQQYQASQQQLIQQQLQQLSYTNNQQSQSQLNQLMDSSPNQTYHLSPSTSQQQINTNENTKVKNSYLSSKPTSPHSYLGNTETQSSSKSFQKFSQSNNLKESGYFSNPFGQGLSSSNNSKSNKCMTPINEKGNKIQNSYLKKSQLIVTQKNQNNSNMLNTSTNNNSNTSFLKQSHSRSPLSSNQIEKENNYLSHFDSSSLYINDKSKRMSQVQQQSQSQSHLQQSPFSYLSNGHASQVNNQNTSNLNNLSGMSKSKSSKSPKQSNSLQMVTQSLETPAGNFFSSHLSRKKNLSTVNYNNFTQNMEKQSSSSSSQQNQQQSYTMSTQHNFDSSPISNNRRINQFNKNESSEMIQSNGQNSFLLSSNLKDQELMQNKTHDYGSYTNNKNSGFLSNYPNSSRFDQYRSVDGYSEGQSNRNFFPKTYLNIETKDSYVSLKKKNITMGGEQLSGMGQNKSSNGILTTDNNFITLNEQELSFQNDQEDNLMMMINQQSHNQTNMQPGNSYCYGYYNEDESNFLNSTNFLNLTNLQINTQNNTMIAMSNNYNGQNGNNFVNKNSSTNGSQVLQNNQNNNNNIYQQYNMNNNNNNDNNVNPNQSMQQNNLSNTLNWTNSTNLFNNSVCAGSMLNTTINNILQNMNSTQSTNNTLNNNTNYLNTNNQNNNAKAAAPNIYSSLSQQNQNTNPTNTNANNTPTNTNNNNQANSFSQAAINNISIPANGHTDKLPLDTTPKQVQLFPEPTPNKNQCSSLKSILYDYVMPTIKPITRQFKLLTSHQQNNSQSNFQQSINLNTNNIFGNDSISNSNKQQILNSLNKQLSSKNLSNNASSSNLNQSCNNINNNNMSSNNINNASSIIENNNCLINSNNQFSNFQNPFNFDDQSVFPNSNFLDQKDQIANQIQQSHQQTHQQLGESQCSNQTTPIKIHLKVDSQSVNSFNKNNLFSQNQGTPVLKSPSNKSENNYYQGQSTPAMKSPSNKQDNNASNHQLTPSSQGYGGKLTFCNNPTIVVSSENEQLAMQQYNFSFSNCVNQQKRMQQQQQQHQEQQEQKQIAQNTNTLHPNSNFSSPQKKQIDEKKKGSSQKKEGNLLINQEHRLVESSKQEYSSSPEKPVINILLSQQITVVDGISQVSSQMFNMDHPDPYADQSLIQNFWSIDSFQIGKCLGRGRFGNVYLSRHKLTNMLFAIKQISKKNLIESCMEKQLQQEIKIQTYLNHPNVLKMHGFFDDSQKIYLILELASHGDIYKEIKRETNKKFTEEKAANYIRQVCEGLIYLHSQGIIHRDIKPENILNSYGVLKLSDFGWSIYTEEKRMTFCGTLDYVSPEVVSGKDYDFKVDIWSIGVLTYELITGKPPFENRQNHNEAYQKILMVKYDFPSYISKEAKDFMSRLLVGDPNKRISLESALNHEWILKNTRNCLADWDPKVSEACLSLLK